MHESIEANLRHINWSHSVAPPLHLLRPLLDAAGGGVASDNRTDWQCIFELDPCCPLAAVLYRQRGGWPASMRTWVPGMTRWRKAASACCCSSLPRALPAGMRLMASRWPRCEAPSCT